MVNNKSYYILILSFLIFSCESADLSSVEKKLDSISRTQGSVLDQLDRIEKDQDGLQKGQDGLQEGIAELKKTQQQPQQPSKKDNKKQQPPKADPNKVYDIAIGNSVVLGKKDAPITIIEWTDFQ